MRLEFDTALAKLRMQATEIQVSQLSDMKYIATITVSSAPYQFTAESYHSPLAAKARLMYTALTYIHNVLGYGIIDINHEVRIHIENRIRQFDQDIEIVWHCGGRLVQLNTSFIQQFTRMLVDIESKISADSGAHQILEAMADIGIRVAELRDQFGIALAAFMTKKVKIA